MTEAAEITFSELKEIVENIERKVSDSISDRAEIAHRMGLTPPERDTIAEEYFYDEFKHGIKLKCAHDDAE